MRYILAFLVASLLQISAPAWAEIGEVKSSAGKDSLERDGELIPAKVGLLVEVADVIVTGKNGRVGITFMDSSRFATGPNSRIELTKFVFDPATNDGEFISEIRQGSLAAVSGDIAKHRPDAMRVRTPSSVLSVRGTKFLVKVTPTEK